MSLIKLAVGDIFVDENVQYIVTAKMMGNDGNIIGIAYQPAEESPPLTEVL